MNRESAERLYARSLFEVAKEEGLEQQVQNELRLVQQMLDAYPQYGELLHTPAISGQKKQELLAEVWDGVIHPQTLRFLLLLARQKRVLELPLIVDCYEELYEQEQNIQPVTAITAVPLKPELQKRLIEKLEKLTGKTIRLECQVDASVIGGLLLRMDGEETDATVRGQLAGMEQAIRSAI